MTPELRPLWWNPSDPSLYTSVSATPGFDRNTARAVNIVDARASLLSAERMITGDKYTFIRNAYLQNREFKVKDGQVKDDF
jgi:ABC-type transporter lipoprotein component MlaA